MPIPARAALLPAFGHGGARGLPLAAILLVALLGGAAPALHAQTVYESRDKSGTPTFSDQPSPGARPVTVGPANVVPSTAPPAQASAPASAPAAPAPAYRTLTIVDPPNDGTVHSNTGAFEVQVRSSPGLRSGAGDRVRLVLDGNLLPGRFDSTRIRLTESDWQSAAGGGGVQHTLQAAIVDKSGQLLIESAPVVFYVQRATVGRRVPR